MGTKEGDSHVAIISSMSTWSWLTGEQAVHGHAEHKNR